MDASSAANNIVRFPVERRARPTLELMPDLAPDATDVDPTDEGCGAGDSRGGRR